MKIVLEQEILGREETERTCISIYNDDRDVIASYWLAKEDNPYTTIAATKVLLESCMKRFGWV